MAEIKATCRWNQTPYQVIKGHYYSFHAHGHWRDWTVSCDARGYASSRLRCFEKWRRMRQAQWFSLIGAIDRDPSTYVDIGGLIAEDKIWQAPCSGTLYGFANDAGFMYWNNRGSIDLQLSEVDPDSL
ncbi:MAG: hypothetical protein P8X63_01225 [Desulfuromonadaceae bacterium]|jgi:hypothetical protein